MPSKESYGRRKQAQCLSCYDDLERTLAYAWELLERGVRDRHSPIHTPTVATIGSDGRPSIRTVVLRDCDPAARTLRFHTDRRAPKLQQMLRDPRGSLHTYDPIEKVQLRLDIALEPMEDAERDAIWATTHPMSRMCYQVTSPPGTPLGEPTEVQHDADATQEGAQHFLPIRVHVERIEWLYLAARGHRRAEFSWANEDLISRWLVP